MQNGDAFSLSTPALRLEASLVPWDMAAFQMPVAQISAIEIKDAAAAAVDWASFADWLQARDVRIASCRLGHGELPASMFLEQHGFRFVEMVLHPYLMLDTLMPPEATLEVVPATPQDLPLLRRIAETAFSHERYHVDPRVDKRLADIRYGRWVENTLTHPRQRLFKLMDGARTVALFITEDIDGDVYWHLTAIAPDCQGQGYGRRAWSTMMARHQAQGLRKLSTTISARNSAVLNLYARLQFRFAAPDMTFHWLREQPTQTL
jgi:RimJ/RimL family protein N-acetyltransferase